jgi:hypothetical protein
MHMKHKTDGLKLIERVIFPQWAAHTTFHATLPSGKHLEVTCYPKNQYDRTQGLEHTMKFSSFLHEQKVDCPTEIEIHLDATFTCKVATCAAGHALKNADLANKDIVFAVGRYLASYHDASRQFGHQFEAGKSPYGGDEDHPQPNLERTVEDFGMRVGCH